MAMGHEYCGIVEEVGSAVTTVRPGQFVVGSFCISDNTCPHCRFGFQSSCQQREFMTGAQAPLRASRSPTARWSRRRRLPPDDLIPSLLATSDVLGTGWYAADAARVQPGSTVAVVGDGAVGLMGVLAAKQMGAGRIIAMSRHKTRQDLALEFGATDIVSERGEAGVARIKELTNGIGADSVLECVGTQGVDDAGHPVRAPRRDDRLCRRAAWRRARRTIAVLRADRHAGRPRAGAPLPAAPDRPGADSARSILARSST